MAELPIAQVLFVCTVCRQPRSDLVRAGRPCAVCALADQVRALAAALPDNDIRLDAACEILHNAVRILISGPLRLNGDGQVFDVD